MADKTHDPKDCNLCAMLRHPANAGKAAQLRKHLENNPIPRQGDRP